MAARIKQMDPSVPDFPYDLPIDAFKVVLLKGTDKLVLPAAGQQYIRNKTLQGFVEEPANGLIVTPDGLGVASTTCSQSSPFM